MKVHIHRSVRWLLVFPAAVAAWYAVFIVGMFAHAFLENALCPAGQMESGMCTNRNVQSILDVVIHLFVALSATAVVLGAAATTPSHRNRTAWIAFAAGVVIALTFGAAAWMYMEAFTAVAAGLATALAINRFLPSARLPGER